MFTMQAVLSIGRQGIQVPWLSSHAEVRLQQRGIRFDVLDCLLAYGRREHDHTHCEIAYFDAKALERIERYEGALVAQLANDHRDVYAVINSDGCVVTTGHRFRRILRDKSQSSLRPGRTRRPRQLRRFIEQSTATNIDSY